MKSIKKDQTGFSAVEALLVLVIVAVIGVVGWYVLKAKNKTNSSYNNAAGSSTVTKPANTKKTVTTTNTANSYVGWKTYDTNFGLSFKYPAAWFAQNNSTDGSFITLSSIKNPVAGERSTQTSMPQYNNNLVLVFSSGGASYQYKIGQNNTVLLDSSLNINGTNYCLIGNKNSATTGNPVTDISVATCSNNKYSDGLVLNNKKIVTADITSAGNGGAATVAVSLTSKDYTTIKAILASVKY